MSGLSYADSGVDIDAGDRAVQLMKTHVARATRTEVVGGLGGFAGLFHLDVAKYTKPLLASSTDGVGTKIAIARALGVHDTVGIDLVAMVVDDLVVCGAEPLFLQDYVATGKVVPEKIAAIVSGIAQGCVLAGCALVGGETAEHPGLMAPDDYDLAATAVGVVEAAAVLGPERVAAGDVLVALRSSGLHSNGFSLVRRIIADADLSLTADLDGVGALGPALLEPTAIYALPVLAAIAAAPNHAWAHITGGGLAENLARVIPAGLTAVVDRGSWAPQPLFDLLAARGGVSLADAERTFNRGVGMVGVLPADSVGAVLKRMADAGVEAWVCGTVEAAEAGALGARCEGTHPV